MKDIEILFWKVIHNKYLFNLIFQHIHKTNWIKQPTISDPTNGFMRLKFKYITSLEWMIKNKQYQLLICKLKSKQEMIDITQHGIELLFKITASTKDSEKKFL
ncbi:hypothetical protein DDB_G0273369 [Dictyostelium discoideum AX4]|uniref:Uncharacterized protein n=1 Tax=Dictyostelium discoideum TaxID=44689 RepID=Q557B1_DICDI|nr:hypothetical protein DDB_G0273683 [Dictyostelium discoideum AX4]XP_644792.1 hypothetical protein DDB_G0273369 [Dictyostelium discoideum AX4]EAL70532.1 hypothetical protein DDB_G0273683 [Dictyostelium discoideum AX4]EAL70902.1 hypothetical protein DDB_G0273369 [Dictyostelium discoideum AX4]|eukprot:XP_644458.1 hypothetical protein DDB_G0273683 [Dictyostelium discoideum AX4]